MACHCVLYFCSMKDEMIQLYLNNSATASAREVCLLGAPRCHGIGTVLGALGFSEEQVRDALLEGNAWLLLLGLSTPEPE